MTTYIVDPDAGAGYDYSSLNAAFAAQAGAHTFSCRSSSGSADTTGALSTASNQIVAAASGHEAAKDGWDTSKYRLSVAGHVITLAYGFLNPTLTNLQLETTGTAYGRVVVNVNPGPTGASATTIQGCRVRKNSGSGNAQIGIQWGGSVTAGSTIDIFNTIIEGFSTASSKAVYVTNTSYTVQIFQSISYGNATGINANASATIKNSASFTNADDFFGSFTPDYCASDDGDGTNAVSPSGSDWTNEFNAPASGDFTLLNGGNCYLGGTTLTGGPSTDIDGDSWDGSSPSIGIDEYAAAAATTTGLVPIKRPWTRQPQQPVAINPKFAKPGMSVFLPPFKKNLSGSGSMTESTAAAYGITPYGKTFAYTGDAFNDAFTLPTGSAPESYLFVAATVGANNSVYVLGSSADGIGFDSGNWKLRPKGSNRCISTVAAAAGDVVYAQGIDGDYKLVTQNEVVTNTGSFGNLDLVEVGDSAANSLALIVRWEGTDVPNDAEIQQLVNNPWQIFEPQTQYLPTGAAAAGGTTDGALSIVSSATATFGATATASGEANITSASSATFVGNALAESDFSAIAAADLTFEGSSVAGAEGAFDFSAAAVATFGGESAVDSELSLTSSSSATFGGESAVGVALDVGANALIVFVGETVAEGEGVANISSVASVTFAGESIVSTDFDMGSLADIEWVGTSTGGDPVYPNENQREDTFGGGYGWGDAAKIRKIKNKKLRQILEDDEALMEIIKKAMPELLSAYRKKIH